MSKWKLVRDNKNLMKYRKFSRLLCDWLLRAIQVSSSHSLRRINSNEKFSRIYLFRFDLVRRRFFYNAMAWISAACRFAIVCIGIAVTDVKPHYTNGINATDEIPDEIPLIWHIWILSLSLSFLRPSISFVSAFSVFFRHRCQTIIFCCAIVKTYRRSETRSHCLPTKRYVTFTTLVDAADERHSTQYNYPTIRDSCAIH